jgi:hypothetical protein
MPTPAEIRTLFLEARPTYTIEEAARVFGMSLQDVRAWMESGELEGVESVQGLAISWEELVSFDMEFWSQEVVEEALGADVAAMLPELVRLADLNVRIPRMEVVALERLAMAKGATVSAVLARELLDLVSANSAWLSREVSGFAAALVWPMRRE